MKQSISIFNNMDICSIYSIKQESLIYILIMLFIITFLTFMEMTKE